MGSTDAATMEHPTFAGDSPARPAAGVSTTEPLLFPACTYICSLHAVKTVHVVSRTGTSADTNSCTAGTICHGAGVSPAIIRTPTASHQSPSAARTCAISRLPVPAAVPAAASTATTSIRSLFPSPVLLSTSVPSLRCSHSSHILIPTAHGPSVRISLSAAAGTSAAACQLLLRDAVKPPFGSNNRSSTLCLRTPF